MSKKVCRRRMRRSVMIENPLHFKTVTELASLIESRQISPVDITETLLGRIETLDSETTIP